MSAPETMVTVYLYDGTAEEHPDAVSWDVVGYDQALRLELYAADKTVVATCKHETWSHVRRVPVETIQTPPVGAGAAADGGHDAGEASSSLSQPAGVEGVGAPSAMGAAPAPDPHTVTLTRQQGVGGLYVNAECPQGHWFRWRHFQGHTTHGAGAWLAEHIGCTEELPVGPSPFSGFDGAFVPVGYSSLDEVFGTADGGEECRS